MKTDSRAVGANSAVAARRVRRGRRAFTLIETLTVALVSILLGAGLWTLMRSGYDSQYDILAQNSAYAYARTVVDTMADSIRGASVITSASASDITYTDGSGNSIRYWLSGSSLMKQVNGAPAGGTVVYSSVTGLTFTGLGFTYWWPNGSTWSSASSNASPATVDQVDIAVTVAFKGSSRKISSSAKLRQLP